MKAESLPAAPRRLVVDTNVLISGILIAGSSTARLIQHIRKHEHIVMCESTFHELATRLDRPKFDRYISLDLRRAFLRDLHAIAQWQPNPKAMQSKPRSRDANDDMFIDLALQSNAHLLISGDKDITSLTNELAILGLIVLTPSEASAILEIA